MKNSKQTILFTISLVTLLAAVSLFVFFLHVIKNKNNHTSAVLTTLENNLLRKQNIDTITKKVNEVERTRDTINSYFVNTKEIDSFVNYLESLGNSSMAELRVERFESIPNVPNTLSVRVSINGQFSNVIRTFKLLENSPYKISINNFNMNHITETVTETINGKEFTKDKFSWQSTVTFNILTS